MKKFISIIIMGAVLLMTGLFSACEEELPINEEHQLNGVDRGHQVQLEFPLMAQNSMNEVVVSRAGEADLDMRLASVLVMVYEAVDPLKPQLNKLISSHFFDEPVTNDNTSQEGWITNGADRTKGLMRMTCPVGDVYIYMVANWTNAFIEFAPGVTENELKDQANIPQNQLELIKNFIPTWNGNVHTVDGIIPMIATVNNSTGLCHVDAEGRISYYKDGASTTPVYIANDMMTKPNNDNAFDFKRLMAKLTMKFKLSGQTQKPAPGNRHFTPLRYKLHNGATHISPTTQLWTELVPDFQPLLTKVQDSERNNFGTQTPNEFTIYLPENLKEGMGALTTWSQREKMVKDAKGKNQIYTKDSDLAGKYIFENAPKYGSYVEVSGKFEDPANDIISAETRFFIHLGNFGKKLNDFSVKRDHHYEVNVTINGVNDIIVESKDRTDQSATEINPAEDGLVYIGGLRAYCDAHFDQVEMVLDRAQFTKNQDFAVIFSSSPFGSISLFYYPANGTDRPVGEARNVITGELIDLEIVKKHLRWVRMRKQKKKGELAAYNVPNEKYVTVFEALDELWTTGKKEYYTAFIDEYYYTQHPLDPNKELHLKDFINKADRSIALGKNINISKDGSSVSVDAITVVYQKAIATFYDLDKYEIIPYGVESVSEMGKFQSYGNLPTGEADYKGLDWDGRAATVKEFRDILGKQNKVNWKKNGWLLSKDEKTMVDSGRDRLIDRGTTNSGFPWYKEEDQAFWACLAKNRDFNGNGMIDKDELRWYNPSLNQLLGLWIGEPALPTAAALYKGSTSTLTDPNTCVGGIYTSSYGVRRVLWSEQGCSFGGNISAEARAVRNLGATPTDIVTTPSAFYKFDESTRTIEVYLSNVALRGFSPSELAPHHERSSGNKVYNKIQLADHPFYQYKSAYCEQQKGEYGGDFFWQAKATPAANAKKFTVTMASQYEGTEVYAGKTGEWRLPNQREIALMVMAAGPNFQVKNGLNEKDYIQVSNICYQKGTGHTHNPKANYNWVIHCRTSFSNPNYTPHGFMYNVRDNKIQNMWEENNVTPGTSPDQMGENLGMRKDGTAIYFTVRDVK